MESTGPCVIIATYRRPVELRRLLDGFEAGTLRPQFVIVADNAALPETGQILANRSFSTFWLPLSDNPGPGAAWRAGAEHAKSLLAEWEKSWFLFCDDDIVVGAELLADARATLDRDEWELAAPLLTDADGRIWGFPEPLDRAQRREIRQTQEPRELQKILGSGPHPLCWATGACLFVTANALASHGSYRTDFFMLGEDLEFSMRVASGGRAVFYPEWIVPHWPLAKGISESRPVDALAGERRKFLALLQNLTYLAFHSPHSRHMAWYLPGNYRRYLKTFGHGLGSWREMLWCFLGGSVLGQAAGGVAGERLRKSLEIRR